VSSTETGAPVTGETVFEAASLSKPVFAYAVMRLVERGEFDLDEPLAEILPYERLEHEERYLRITPRMVLTHSTGLPNWGEGRLGLAFDPGERFSYSGEGFVYLQKAVETITGKPLDAFMRQELFALLEQEGLGSGTLDAVFTPQIAAPNRDGELGEVIAWGLGWALELGESGTAFWHWGDNGPFKAFVLGYRDRGAALVYFANSDEGLSIAGDVLAAFFGGEHPSVEWLDYERHDAPGRVGRSLHSRVGLPPGRPHGVVRRELPPGVGARPAERRSRAGPRVGC
jgi:CubicO group peptidase (beta-lactamase class C family)